MIYRVEVSSNADKNLRDYYLYAAKHAPHTATRWAERFQDALQTLANLPERFSAAPEAALHSLPIRQMLFGKGRNVYRVLFTVRDDKVRVLHIRRSTMDLASLEEIFPVPKEDSFE